MKKECIHARHKQDFENTEVEGNVRMGQTQEGGGGEGRGWLQISSMKSSSVADPDPHQFGKLDPESVKLDPGRIKVKRWKEALEGQICITLMRIRILILL
jgi:hypothetical protein